VRSRAFRHEALFYSEEQEFLAGTVPFLRAGLEAGEPALVVVSREKAARMKAELNGESDSVSFVDMEELGRNPGCIIPAWRDFVAEQGGEGRPVRGIGEPIWPELSADELVECQRHEWLLNMAFMDAPAWTLLCPYDAGALDPAVLEGAHMTHPYVTERGICKESHGYRDPQVAGDPFEEPLTDPPPEVEELAFTLGSLATVRAVVSRQAASAGADEREIEDFVLAANELATNSVLHAGTSGTLLAWRNGDTLLCEVRDEGTLDDPLVGRQRPEPSQPSGRGLWLTNQLCDLVQIRSRAGGTAVRIHMGFGPKS